VKRIMLEVYNADNIRMKMDLNRVLKYEVARTNVYKYGLEVIKAITVLKRSELIKRVKSLPYSIDYNKELWINDGLPLTIEEDEILEKAIRDTSGIITLCCDKAVNLYYTANCGGGTANSEDVIGFSINYLRKVLCKFCDPDLYENIIKISDISDRLDIKASENIDEINGVLSDVKRDETGRVINLSVLGKPMSGEEFIKLIGAKSNRIYFNENSILIKSIGNGSGLGICLDGAKCLENQGYGFKEIINYYYTGIEFAELADEGIFGSLKNKKIVIDPGHGGSDYGNKLETTYEKDVNLTIALELADKLRALGADAIMTRTNNIDIPTVDRVECINTSRPGFFISIHQNGFMLQGINGVEAYCYEGDTMAHEIALYITESISSEMNIKNRGVKVGDYYLLRETKVSGLILECMYMTGCLDSKKYIEDNYSIIANAIFKGICKFYEI
jgi:stage II sporulation protein D